jgi:hypothetical protein
LNWGQLKTILWLRWRLTCNMWLRSKGVGAVITAVIAVSACLLGAASFLGALAGGILGLGRADSFVIWAICCGLTAAFLFLWLVGLIQEIQRSEAIDLQRLMHLPVALGQIFVINYFASHLALSIVLFVPALMGLAVGLAISRGPAMLLLAPLGLAMVLMVTAWTYCLRGWLATLMSNPRRRRNVIMGLVFSFVLLGQAPNIYFNVFHLAEGHASTGSNGFAKFRSVQKFVPPLWVPLGAQALADGKVLPALLATLGCGALGALGLARAYRSTVRFYRGDSGPVAARRTPPHPRPPAAAAVQAKAQPGSRFLELRFPAVPEQATALALATFRSLLRAPEVKMAWGSSLLVPLLVGGTMLFRQQLQIPETAKPFIATGAVAFSMFMLAQFLSNQFGFDRDGFRSLILSPANRKLILLGKNLACLPVGAGFSLLLLGLISIRLKPSPGLLAAVLLQLAALLMLAGLVGNLLSILVPYRIQPGSMKPTKMPGLAVLLMLVCHLLLPIAMAPVFLPALLEFLWRNAGWSAAVPVNFILSLALAGVASLAYWQALGPLGRLLQRRETKILGIVTVEVE